MKKCKQMIVLLLSLGLLSGCWDLKENERMFYAQGIGVDYVDGMYKVYIQLISFANVAKSEQVNQDVVQSEVNSETGETFTEAIFKLYRAIDEEVYWGHLTFIVLSEEVMKDGRINSIVNTITQHHDMRYQTWIYCTDEPLEEFLIVAPLLKRSITLTALADPYNSFEQVSYLEPVNLRKLIIRLNEPNHEVSIPYVTLKKGWKTQKEENMSVEIAGAGILTPKEFKGFIKRDKAKGLQWMSNEMRRGQITSDVENDGYTTLVFDTFDVKITPIVKNINHVKFDINISTTVSLNSHTETVTKKDIQEAVDQKMKKEIMTSFKEGLEIDADVYRLSEALYRKNIDVWKKLQKNGKIELTEDSIRNININIEKIHSGRKKFKTTIEKGD